MLKEGNYNRSRWTGNILKAERVAVVCDRCGKEWTTRYNNYLNYRLKRENDLCMGCISSEIMNRPEVKAARCKIRKWTKEKVKEEILNRYKNDLPLNDAAVKMSSLYQAARKRSSSWENALACSGLSLSMFRKVRKLTIHDMQEVAKSKNGKCLSKEYVNCDVLLKWECINKHTWMACASSILYQKTWCPVCSKNRHSNEEMCRYIIENLTGKQFPPSRRILGNGQELDGYCKELSLAFEYQGQQHYYFVKLWHRSKEKFRKKQKDDIKKERICKEKQIKLIKIPYTISTVEEKEKFLITKLEELNVEVVASSIDYSKFWKTQDVLAKYKKIARDRGGKCLSTYYIGRDKPMKWECLNGHQWEARPDVTSKGRWCSVCIQNKKRKDKIREIRKLAQQRNGKCLSKKYINSRIPLIWQCQHGHKWRRVLSPVKAGFWCPFCRGVRKSLQDAKELAEKNDGKCLSNKYINVSTKMLWQCADNHMFSMTYDCVKQGRWCAECYNIRRRTRKTKVNNC